MADTVDESLRWSVILNESRPGARIAILVVALAAATLGFLLFRNAGMAVLGGLMVLGSTTESWLPTHCELSPDGATTRLGISVSSMKWVEVRRVVLSAAAVKLSPLASVGPTDAFRGVTLRTRPELRDEIVRFIKSRCGEDVRFLGE